MGAHEVMRRFCVIGDPVQHSLSPALHTAAYAALGITDASYERVHVPRGGLLEALASPLDAFNGISVTMPHKEAALSAADAADPLAWELGVANTLIPLPRAAGARQRWAAFNTDVVGIAQSFRDAGVDGAGASGTVLGSGATAFSAVAALHELGVRSLSLVARAEHKLKPLADWARRHGVAVRVRPLVRAREALDADLLISALALPGAEALAEQLRAEHAGRAAGQIAVGAFLDVLYDPRPTPLQGMLEPRVSLDGLDMLARQAVRQVELMLGIDAAPVSAILTAARQAAR